jgi:hypothetical protein
VGCQDEKAAMAGPSCRTRLGALQQRIDWRCLAGIIGKTLGGVTVIDVCNHFDLTFIHFAGIRVTHWRKRRTMIVKEGTII